MDQPRSKEQMIQKLIHSDIEMDFAILRFLHVLTVSSLANQVRGLPTSTLPRILVSLTTIQKYHDEKIKVYQAFTSGRLGSFVSVNLMEKLERIEKHANSTVRLMGRLTADPSVRRYLDDFIQNVYEKIHFYQSLLLPPAKPWISPNLRGVCCFHSFS